MSGSEWATLRSDRDLHVVVKSEYKGSKSGLEVCVSAGQRVVTQKR